MSDVLALDVVSDVVCPWCYLGKRRLEHALTLVPELEIQLRWRPFRLDPTIPQGGIDRTEYLTRKFGNVHAIDGAHATLERYGAAEGIDYRFDLIARSPNTIDAHRVVHWADGPGQDAVVERLFRGYFSEGADVGDPATLARLAGEAGLDAAEVARRLATEEDREAVEAEIDDAYRIGVNGVPCFILDKRYAVVGAQSAETIAEAIRSVAAQRKDKTAFA